MAAPSRCRVKTIFPADAHAGRFLVFQLWESAWLDTSKGRSGDLLPGGRTKLNEVESMRPNMHGNKFKRGGNDVCC